MTLIFFISTLIFAYLYFEEKRKNKQYRTVTQTVAASEATVSAEANPAMVAQPQVQIKTSKIEEAQEYWADEQLKKKSTEASLKDLRIVLVIIIVAMVILLLKN